MISSPRCHQSCSQQGVQPAEMKGCSKFCGSWRRHILCPSSVGGQTTCWEGLKAHVGAGIPVGGGYSPWEGAGQSWGPTSPVRAQFCWACPNPTHSSWSRKTVGSRSNGSVVLLCCCEGRVEHTLSFLWIGHTMKHCREPALHWRTELRDINSQTLPEGSEFVMKGSGIFRASSLGLGAGKCFQNALNKNTDQEKKYIVKWLFGHHCQRTQCHKYFYGLFACERDCQRHYSVDIGIFSSAGW